MNSQQAKLIMAIVAIGVGTSAKADLTFSNTYTGTSITGFSTAVNDAEGILSGLFSNNVTVNIQFEGTTATGLADANFNPGNFPPPFGPGGQSYASVKTELQTHSAAHPENTALASSVAALPASVSCPTCGTTNIMVPDAETLALTGVGAGYAEQGFIRVNPNFNYDTNGGPIGANQIDLVGVMLHEITHVMGRVDYAFVNLPGNGGNNSSGDPFMTLMDLDRFNCGSTTRNTVAANACFSANGGTTDLGTFSPTSDTGDWNGVSPGLTDPNNAFANFGTLMPFSAADVQQMNALGWDPKTAPVPEPDALILLMTVLAGVGLAAGKRRLRRNTPAIQS